MHIHQLHHLAFGNRIGRVGKHLHDAHILAIHHHLKGAGVQKVTYQDACWIAKCVVGGGKASSQRGFIDHIIVQKGRGVNELHNGRHVETLFPSEPQSTAAEQE